MSKESSKPSAISEEKVSVKKKPSKTVEDKGLIESLHYAKGLDALPKSNASASFETVKEAEDTAKENIVYAVNERLNAVRQDISDLQKKGYELSLDGLKLLSVPLKVRVWLADPSRKDLEALFGAIESVGKKLEPLKKEVEQKELEAEKKEAEASSPQKNQPQSEEPKEEE